MLFDKMTRANLEELHIHSKDDLRAIVAIHNTNIGPALGGCRFIEYSDDDAALQDAVRLAAGMSYKNALAGIPQGGGKCVIMKPKREFDREKLFKQFGEFVEKLGGRYITAMDSGTTVHDMDIIFENTASCASHSKIGNPSPFTARGCYEGIKAATEHQGIDLNGATCAIQGLGNVGYAIAEFLANEGVKLMVADIDQAKVDRAVAKFNVTAVSVDEVLLQRCDILAPCGLGGAINKDNVERIDCHIIAGCANNVLDVSETGDRLHARGILYAPDYVINAGGVIYASMGFHNKSVAAINEKVSGLYATLKQMFARSARENLPAFRIADRMAEECLYK